MGTIFKVFYWICYNIASVWFSSPKAHKILAFQPGEPEHPSLEGEVFSTGQQGMVPLKTEKEKNCLTGFKHTKF